MSAFAPPDVAIPTRDLSFSGPGCARRWYAGGDVVESTVFSAMSCTFPVGERFFIDSLRLWRDGAPPALARDIADFIRQEALHSREHTAFNALVADLGYDVAPLTATTHAVLAPYVAAGRLRMLGLTMALEHFTALFAHELLANPRRLAAAPANVRALWRWHAVEEIEHKGVTFDAFLWVSREWSAPARHLFRTWALLAATRVLLTALLVNMAELFRQDGAPAARTWLGALRYLFGPGGLVTNVAGGWLAWFRPGFHPWTRDDRALAAEAAADLAAWAAPESPQPQVTPTTLLVAAS